MFLYLLEVKLTNTLAVVFLFRRQNLLESKPEHWIVTELIRPLLIWDPLDPEKKDIENINTNHLLIIHFKNVKKYLSLNPVFLYRLFGQVVA